MKGKKRQFVNPVKAEATRRRIDPGDSEDEGKITFNEDLIHDEVDEYNDNETRLSFDDDDSEAIESDHEDEVFSLGLSEDDQNSDIEGLGEESHLPDRKAWGKSRKSFYNTDYVEEDWGTGFKGSDEEQIADMEEEEAKIIQKRLMEELRDEDFGIDFFVDEKVDDDGDILIEKNLSHLSKEEKLKLLKSEAPEFNGILKDFNVKTNDLLGMLPLVKAVRSRKIPNSLVATYISVQYRLLLNYLTNLSFYMVLKANHTPVDHHPIVARLAHFSKLLNRLREAGVKLEPLLAKIQSKLDTNATFQITHVHNERHGGSPHTETARDTGVGLELKDGGKEEGQMIDSLEMSSKRGINYQIEKNKGLTVRRKKELRNPRVKYKNRYNKAKIRRKGMIRLPRTELERYGGEISGIKSKIIKSVAIK